VKYNSIVLRIGARLCRDRALGICIRTRICVCMHI
jgi:hypothetical protein